MQIITSSFGDHLRMVVAGRCDSASIYELMAQVLAEGHLGWQISAGYPSVPMQEVGCRHCVFASMRADSVSRRDLSPYFCCII